MLTHTFQEICRSKELGTDQLQSIVQERIAAKSGAARGVVSGRPSIFVQPIPLEPSDAGATLLETTADWIARRIKASGQRVFEVSVRLQPDRLVLVAQWPRAEDPEVRPGLAKKTGAVRREFDRGSFTRLIS